MRIRSLISENNQLIPVEVELTLWPGLPVIQFLGLADQHLKESALRIKSAIKASGFEFPIAQQILVNLRPSYIKKNSRGVELAVAAGYLWATGQVAIPENVDELVVYGELTLLGDVIEPEGLSHQYEGDETILTGEVVDGLQKACSFRRLSIAKLSQLLQPRVVDSQNSQSEISRPEINPKLNFSSEQARQIKILSVGTHSAIMAGAAGSGKSTVAKFVSLFRKRPSEEEFKEIKRVQKIFGDKPRWWPLVRPHHSIPVISMIGGGSNIQPGEISRAHMGTLVMDELLEYHPLVQEALREPMEDGMIQVHRLGQMKEFPAKVQVVATTNLCPCGDWSPNKKNNFSCKYNEKRCRSYGQRLSGPFVDRFETIFFVDQLSKRSIKSTDLLSEIESIYHFIETEVGNLKENVSMTKSVESLWLRVFESGESSLSQRRLKAIRNVATTLAFLDGEKQIQMRHFDEALLYCRDHFHKLQRWDTL